MQNCWPKLVDEKFYNSSFTLFFQTNSCWCSKSRLILWVNTTLSFLKLITKQLAAFYTHLFSNSAQLAFIFIFESRQAFNFAEITESLLQIFWITLFSILFSTDSSKISPHLRRFDRCSVIKNPKKHQKLCNSIPERVVVSPSLVSTAHVAQKSAEYAAFVVAKARLLRLASMYAKHIYWNPRLSR
jgi:uncharacterized membrane protein